MVDLGGTHASTVLPHCLLPASLIFVVDLNDFGVLFWWWWWGVVLVVVVVMVSHGQQSHDKLSRK